MRSRMVVGALAVAVAGCAVEHGNQAPQRAGAADQTPGMTQGGGAPGPMHTVFARLRDTVGLGVERISLSVVLAPEMDKTAQRAALESVLEAQRQQDSTLAAIRVLGFAPPSTVRSAHPTGMAMVPFVILEWVPEGGGGWNGVSAANARGPHTTDVQFMADLPVHRRAPGAGAAR